MQNIEYKAKIEKEFGEISLPKDHKEIDYIIESLLDELESVSIQDYHIFQAILVICDWRENNERKRS